MEPVRPMPVFRPVPLLPKWTNPSGKIDLKAIYRRPRRRIGEYDETIHEVNPEDGLPLWDLTTPLPVRRHNDWVSKGFEYVTLADMDSLTNAANDLKGEGLNYRDFICHPHLGPWNPKLYQATAATSDKAAMTELVSLGLQFGVEALEKIRGQVLPESVKLEIARRQDAGDRGETKDDGDAPERPAAAKPAKKKPAKKPSASGAPE